MRHAASVVALAISALAGVARAQTANLYTKPVAGAAGGITGRVNIDGMTHVLALNRDHVQCFRAQLTGREFKFIGLPTGKYDLVIVTKTAVYEGLELGSDAGKVAATPRKNLETRLVKADSFFNKAKMHRFGLIDGGEKLVAFVERIRDKTILQQSGEQLMSNLRRFEVIDYVKSSDDWTEAESRHIFREEFKIGEGADFLRHKNVSELGNIRVIDAVKDIGSIVLPP
jgi:hypothetical protein